MNGGSKWKQDIQGPQGLSVYATDLIEISYLIPMDIQASPHDLGGGTSRQMEEILWRARLMAAKLPPGRASYKSETHRKAWESDWSVDPDFRQRLSPHWPLAGQKDAEHAINEKYSSHGQSPCQNMKHGRASFIIKGVPSKDACQKATEIPRVKVTGGTSHGKLMNILRQFPASPFSFMFRDGCTCPQTSEQCLHIL